MRSFEQHFSEKSIIEELCRARIQLASSRHGAAFFHNIARTAKAPHTVSPPAWGHIPVSFHVVGSGTASGQSDAIAPCHITLLPPRSESVIDPGQRRLRIHKMHHSPGRILLLFSSIP